VRGIAEGAARKNSRRTGSVQFMAVTSVTVLASHNEPTSVNNILDGTKTHQIMNPDLNIPTFSIHKPSSLLRHLLLACL
jgi:hypothetical protein